MQTLSQILTLGFLNSRSGFLCRLDKKSQFFTSFGIKLIELFFSRIQGCNYLYHFVNVLVYLSFHVTVKCIFRRSFCTFSKHSLSLTICTVFFITLQLCIVFQILQKFLFPCRSKLSWLDFFYDLSQKCTNRFLSIFCYHFLCI